MSKRQIVSYNDLFSETEEAGQAGTSEPAPSSVEETAKVDVSEIVSCQGTWDDSELIQAWDSTIADYRKQHANVLGDQQAAEERRQTESKVGEWKAVEDIEQVDAGRTTKRARTESASEGHGESQCEYGGWQVSNPEPPASEDDALYRLNMSWYYAGYYAGYYQAYRHGKSQANTD
ncbi:hypothetical protein DL89DRAFT_268380 [Linderina pennispora]|uniref:Survival Motor Neuron Gemin2-binding domain-containing protein n=1 Tax=Linderina pennispora TaxID=61395 RepID=A0A1Y1W4W1_9FUNG|nr:uncharacterized protein DL89DRAFT_268380 [Linderina pennispora]ORX68570.1 hypothetical protein DL89DRAFT_268380 [Linderina pennispora]